MIRNRNRLLACALLCLLLCGCGGVSYTQRTPTYTVGVVLKAMNSQHWMEMRSGMEQAATDNNIDLKLLYPSAENREDEQDDLIRDTMNSGIDLLMVAPCNSYHTRWFVAEAEQSGLPVLTVDTQAFDSDLPYIGADNTAIGRMAAQHLSDVLPEGASVAIISGASNQSSHNERIQAFRDTLRADLSVSSIQYTDSEFSQGYECAKNLAETPVRGIFCTSAVLGLGAAAVQPKNAARPLIVAVDTQADAMQAVQDGTIDALITQSGYDIGYRAIETALVTLRTKKMPDDVLLSGELLTKE